MRKVGLFYTNIQVMKVIKFFDSDNRDHWLQQIKRCDWQAGQFLYRLLITGDFDKTLGQNSQVFMLIDGDELVSFCTLSSVDDTQPTDLTPWIGFVYTFPQYRGSGCAGELLRYVELYASKAKHAKVYVSTDITGFYERYGYTFLSFMTDVNGAASRVYYKHIGDW